MNILETILSVQGGSQGGGAVGQLARQFGLNESQVTDVLGQLAPALGRGIQENTRTSSGLDALTQALRNGNHQRYIDDPDSLSDPHTAEDGNGILGHIFGGKEVSRELAGRAAEQTGVDSSIIKKLLPLAASLAMGGLSKQTQGSQASAGTQLTDVIGSFLDSDGDGSALDDLMGLAGKFLGR